MEKTNKKENRKVSIVTPVYNGEQYLSETIESVLAQTYTDWEMLIINDGSNDKSMDIAQSYADKDERIKVYSQSNAGSAAARNNGIRRAEGRYIALLDADDLWEPLFLKRQLQLMEEKHCQLVYGAHKRINGKGEEILQPFIPPKQLYYKDLLKTCSISCLTGLYDTYPYGKVYLHEEFRSLRDDYVYWLTILRKTGVAYGNQGIVGSYRIHVSSLTANKLKMVKPQYRVYREVEKLGVLKSCYYLINWAIHGVFKYWK
ncbi:MAG: glycosyltransferase [Paludibacteraceae bacterium]|nr:glycosyltransferase [Paludibacteraceae bacterium]